jgi:hypothetical protein
MCFSAGASFTASAILTTVGVVSIKTVPQRSQLPFASIPLLFAAQQATEGVLWVSLTHPEYSSWHNPATHIFLVFAQVLWPAWVPYSVMSMEKEPGKRKILKYLTIIGVTISCYLAFCIAFFDLHSTAANNHISYIVDFPHELNLITGLVYFVPTVLPLLFSSVRGTRILGLANFAAFVFVTAFFHEHIASIWCFFAAILSAIILAISFVLKKEIVGGREANAISHGSHV